MNRIDTDWAGVPFALSKVTRKKVDDCVARIETHNESSAEGVPSAQAERLRSELGLRNEMASLLDSIDGEQAQAIADAEAAAKATEDKANADLIAASIATPETVWYFADKLGGCKPVADARATLQAYRQWTTRGSRHVNQQGIDRASNELLGYEQEVDRRTAAAAV